MFSTAVIRFYGLCMTKSHNRLERERLPRFKAGISVVKNVKATVMIRAEGRFLFTEAKGVE
jgi:hypothetical protein